MKKTILFLETLHRKVFTYENFLSYAFELRVSLYACYTSTKKILKTESKIASFRYTKIESSSQQTFLY